MLAARPIRMRDPGNAGDVAWQLLCGHMRCSGELAILGWFRFRGRGRFCGYAVAIHSGFKESQPNVWEMGGHAQKSCRRLPRRLRHSATFLDKRRRLLSMAHCIIVHTSIAPQRSYLRVTCPDCSSQSVIRLDRIIQEVQLPEYTPADYALAMS